MEAIISYIISGQGDFNKVSDWQGFLDAIKNKCFDIFEREMIEDIVMTRIPGSWTAEDVF